jgi:hypothetical protein
MPLTRAHGWALDTLYRHGYRYSASAWPGEEAAMASYQPRYPHGADGILDLPAAHWHFGPLQLNLGAALTLPLCPYPVARLLLRQINAQAAQPAVVRLDWHGPRMRSRLRALSEDFRWARIDHLFPVTP